MEAPIEEPDATVEQQQQQQSPEIANPPNGGIDGRPAATVDDLMAHLQAFARTNGFAVIRRNAGKEETWWTGGLGQGEGKVGPWMGMDD